MAGTHGLDASFLADIIANPADDVPRLVFADWLDENGQEARAELIRVQCELARPAACEWVDTSRGLSCEKHNEQVKPYRLALTCPACKSLVGLRRRERELLAAHEYQWSLSTSKALVARGIAATFRRGFVASVELTAAGWLAHGPVLVRAAPLEEVRLSDVAFVQAWADSLFYPAADNIPWPWGHRGQPTQEEAEADLSRALIEWAKAQPAP